MNTIIASELKRVLDPSYVTFENITDHEREFLKIVLLNLFDNNYDTLFKLLSTFMQIQEFAKNGGAPIAKEIIQELNTLEMKGEIEEMGHQELETVGEFIDENGRHYNLVLGEEKLSFFRIMLEEKELDEVVMEIEHNEFVHMVEMDVLIQFIESINELDQKQIEVTMRHIDFKNGDMMHYMKHLATGYVAIHF